MDDFILHKKSVIPSEDCIKTIGIFEYHKEDHERWEQFDHTLSEVFVRREDLPLCIGKPLHDMVEDYRKKYSVLDVLSQSWSLYRNIKIQRYHPNEGYTRLHCENDAEAPDMRHLRILAWMIYLNDVKDGGHTEFPVQDKKFQPREGDMLMWPAYWTHPHRGVVSKTETKYIMTGWYAFN